MTSIEHHPIPSPHDFAVLIEALWAGEISEETFIKDSHQQGVSIAQIEWELEQIKAHDGVPA